ncbi:MAG: sulfite exporter TauE/SafE family protein [Saprospiraceae bacterium]|nr:sulfite exporter TauE/SafE family protein [Saprospiraceae bacterium]
MELELYHYAIAITGGFVAAVMNTLAGYGSIITLTILMDVLGLPANMANGTNRVNILSNSLAGAIGYQQNGKLDLRNGKWILITVCVGAVCGVLLAINVSNDQFRAVFKYLIVVLFLSIIIKPKRWIKENSTEVKIPVWKMILFYFPIGFYGGFIQMGMGIIFLMAGVLVSGFTIIRANALKLVIIFLYTILSLIIFHFNGLVDWKIGAVLSIGTALGGYLTASYSSKIKNANLYAYRFLVVVVVAVLLYTFNVFSLFSF